MKKEISIADINKKAPIIQLYKEVLSNGVREFTSNAFISFFSNYEPFRLLNIKEVENDIISYGFGHDKRTKIRIGRFLTSFFGHIFDEETIRDLIDLYKSSWIENKEDYTLILSRKEEDFHRAYRAIKTCMSEDRSMIDVRVDELQEVYVKNPYLLFATDPKVAIVYLTKGEEVIARALLRSDIELSEGRLVLNEEEESVRNLYVSGRLFNIHGDALKLAYFMENFRVTRRWNIKYYSFIVGMIETVVNMRDNDKVNRYISIQTRLVYYDENRNVVNYLAYDEETDKTYIVELHPFFYKIIRQLTSEEEKEKTMIALARKNDEFIKKHFNLRTKLVFNRLKVVDYRYIKDII